MRNTNDGSVIINTVLDLTGVNKGAAQINRVLQGATGGVLNLEREFRKLGSTAKKVGMLIGSAFAVSKLVSFAKSAIDMGSDLAEVQNVVDSVFTSMSDSVDEFARNAASSYGLSETMAKQYIGTYGAMAKAFGFTEKQAYQMSTALTGLAGDVASFYNLDQDVAYTKLKSVFSGETESLKDLGIVMTQTALDAYAMQQGIGKTTAKMTEQEKVAIRYRFIMDQLATASGDFAKTSDGWANQTRILKLQFDSLKASLGAGLINIFTPVLKVINTLLGKLTTLANAFKAFTELLTGKKSSGGSGIQQTADSYGAAADGANDYADATNNVADATRRANKQQKEYLSGLDEIRKFSKDDTSGSSGTTPSTGTGGGVSIGGADVDFGGLAQGTTVVDKLSESISKLEELIRKKDWAGLGKYMADGINTGLQRLYDVINWNTVGPRVTGFINAFTTTFNSLVTNINWALAGRTIGAGLNTIVNTLWAWVTGINWKNLGLKLAEGLNGMLKEVNWLKLGMLLGAKFMLAWELFGGWVSGLNFEAIGKAVADSLNGVFKGISFKKIGIYLKNAINGAFRALKSFTKNFDWEFAAKNVSDGLNEVFKGLDWETAGETLETFWDGIDTFILGIKDQTDWEKVGEGVGTFLSKINWGEHLKNMVEAIGGIVYKAWAGLGKTSAGKFIHAIAFFAIGSKLVGFVNRIATALGGKSATSIVTDKLGSMLAKAIADSGASDSVQGALSGLKGTISDLGTDLATNGGYGVIGASLGIASTIAGLVIVGEKIGQIQDEAKGGNGSVTDYGKLWDYVIDRLKPKLGDTWQTLFDIKEELENSNAPASEFATALRKGLEDAGIPASDVEYVMSTIIGDINATATQMEWLSSVTEGYTTKAKALKETLDYGYVAEHFTEKTDEMDWGIRQLSGDMGLSEIQAGNLSSAILNFDASKPKESFEELKRKMEEMGLSEQQIIDFFKIYFPEATVAVQEAASRTAGNIDEITTSAEQSSAKVSGVSGAMQSFLENVKGKAEDAKEQIKTAIGAIGTSLSESGNSVKTGMGESSAVVDEKAAAIAASVISNWGASEKSVKDNLDSMRTAIAGKMLAMQKLVKEYCSSFAGHFSYYFGDAGAKGAISDFYGYFTDTMNNMAGSVSNAFSNMAASVTGPFNTFIGKLNALISGAQNAQNAIADLLSFDITLPEAVASQVGWSHAWLRIPRRSTYFRVPYLASGAVIPPNAPFTAVLGDQKRGNNIETPENLMRQIFREELRNLKSGNYRFTAELNRRTIFDQVIEEAKLRQDQSGRNPFDI